MSLLNECVMSEWLSEAIKQNYSVKTNDCENLKIYPVKKDCCIKPQIIATDDGNRLQHCLNCGWLFKA